ncbi:MAG: site-specific DNA-methyltransferase [Chitinophagales bacterium]
MSINKIQILFGDSREILKDFPNNHFNLIVTSPPYADARKKHYDSIRPKDYPDFFLSFHEQFWRVLTDDGSMVINIKDKVIDGKRDRYVWKTIMALNDAGWISVEDYIWHKPNAMPGFWKNRLRDEWEYCFHLTKNKEFKMYQNAIKKPIGQWAKKRLENLSGKSLSRHNSENESGFGRDLTRWVEKDSVLPGNTISIPLVGKNMGHPAVYPLGLPDFFIKLFSKENDNVLDPFAGSGTTGVAATNLNRNVVLIDSKEEYYSLMKDRFSEQNNLFLITESRMKLVST